MIDDCLKLTTYFGERDRTKDGFLADALVDIYERRALQTSIVMRGVEGFGIKHHLQTARLLTLSEDLPMVSVAVDRASASKARWRRSARSPPTALSRSSARGC
jgi:PII-like signaling protein